MNANESAAVVLAVSDTGSAWGIQRFREPICGVAALARVWRALVEAGIRDVGLVTDAPSELTSSGEWTHVSRADSPKDLAAVAVSLGARRVFLLCGDLPLVTPATLSAFSKASADVRARRLADSSGVLAFFRSGADAVNALATAAAAFDDPAGPFGKGTWLADRPDDVRRLAAPGDYGAIRALAQERVLAALGANGVLIYDPAHTYIDEGVEIGRGSVVFPGTHVRGESKIGTRCSIGPDAWIESSVVEDEAVVRYSVLEGARVRERSSIGPFAHLRRGSDIGPDARVGNFVEIKASRLGRGVKAGHLSYVGDADVGDGTNVGAGTITCNYDGAVKHRTVIEDGVFIGSNSSLVAPVTIGRGAVIGAGSTITEDVPPGTLAIGRARQVIKERKEAASGEDT